MSHSQECWTMHRVPSHGADASIMTTPAPGITFLNWRGREGNQQLPHKYLDYVLSLGLVYLIGTRLPRPAGISVAHWLPSWGLQPWIRRCVFCRLPSSASPSR